MQGADLLLHIEVHHHVDALSVRPALDLAIPSGLDQPHERVDGGRHRRLPVTAILAVVFPLRHQRVAVGLEGGFEGGRFDVRQGDPPEVVRAVAGLGDRGFRIGPGAGIGARFQFDRGAQLADGGDLGQLCVVRIGPLACPCGDHPDLVQRQSALPQALGAAGKRFQPVGHAGNRGGIAVRSAGLPGHQGGDRSRPGGTPQSVTIDLGNDVDDAPIDRVALTGQLRELLEENADPFSRSHVNIC